TRHLERLFKDDLGMSFVQWRTRRRLNRALMRIRAGATTPSAARSVGYTGTDGLVKAAGRITGLPRAVLTKNLATAIREWREPPERFEAAAARSDSRATAAASSRTCQRQRPPAVRFTGQVSGSRKRRASGVGTDSED